MFLEKENPSLSFFADVEVLIFPPVPVDGYCESRLLRARCDIWNTIADESVCLPSDLPSWEVTLVCIILFVGICNVAFITLRYRLKIPNCGQLAIDQIKWIRKSSV